MKTEAILARVNAVIGMIDDDTHTEYDARYELKALASDLAEQVRIEYAAARGVGNAAKTIRALLKSTKKDARTTLQYAWIDSAGHQCVCDGFRAFRLNEPIPLEERPADAGDPINLDKIIPDVRHNYASMPLPSAKDVKAFIALERAAKGPKSDVVWDFGEGKPAVNAAYLLDLMTVLPDATEIFYATTPNGVFSPLYAKSERGDAVLLPIRLATKVAEMNAAKAAEEEANRRATYCADLLAKYRERAEGDPDYAVSPETFVLMAKYAAVA